MRGSGELLYGRKRTLEMRESEGIRGSVNLTIRYSTVQYTSTYDMTHRWVKEDKIFSMQQS